MQRLSQSQYKELIGRLVPELIRLHGLISYGGLSGQVPKERLDELKGKVEDICSELDNWRPLNFNNGLPINNCRAINMMNRVIEKGAFENPPYVKNQISQAVANELGCETNGELIDKAVEKFYMQKDRFFKHIFGEVMDLYAYIQYGI